MGSKVSTPLTSISDQQTGSQLDIIAEHLGSASLAMGKAADSLYDISTAFSSGIGGASMKNAPGRDIRDNYRTAFSQGIEEAKNGMRQSASIGAAAGFALGATFFAFGPLIGAIGLAASAIMGSFIGGAIGSIVGGVSGFLRGGDWENKRGGFTMSLKDGDFVGREYVDQKKKKRYGQGSKSRTLYSEMDAGFSDLISQEIGLVFADIRRNAVALGFSGSQFDTDIGDLTIKKHKIQTSGKSEEKIAKALEKELLRFANAAAATLPGIEEFALFGEDLFYTVQRLGGALRDVNYQFALVGRTLVESTAVGADWAYMLQELFGGSENMATAMDNYFEAMYTDDQKSAMRAAQARRDVTIAFGEMGIDAIPTTLAAFNELRNSVTDPELFAALTLLGPTFATMVEEATKLASIVLDFSISAAEALRDIMTGPLSNLNPTDQYNMQRDEFERVRLLAAEGDQTALSMLPDLARSFLETSMGYYASGPQYQADFQLVTRALMDMAGMPSTAELTLNAIIEQLLVLNQIRDGLLGGVPGFASGGDFGGGFRIVGENGPELEATGPSRIFNAAQTRGILGGGNSEAVIAELRESNAQLREVVAKLEDIESPLRRAVMR
jgi:hypothetical protein